MTTTKQNMLDLLADERDRLVDEIDGVTMALEASCSSAILIPALLVPGLGPVIVAVARAACSAGDATELRARIGEAERLAAQLEAVGVNVELVDESNAQAMAKVEADVLAVVGEVRRVSILDEAFSSAAQAARGFIGGLQSFADTASSIGTTIALVGIALVGGYFVYSRR